MYTSYMAKELHRETPTQVGVRELRAHLSRYVGEVGRGRSIVVTDRGLPVARLVGVDELPPGLERLIADRLVRLPARPASSPRTWRRPRVKDPDAEGSVADLVVQQRR